MTSSDEQPGPAVVTLGMFIVDTFKSYDAHGVPVGPDVPPQGSMGIGGGGTYAAIGARMWLPAPEVGAVIDRGHDFPPHIQVALDGFGHAMWLFRDNTDRETTRSRNTYRDGVRSFEYLTPRIQVTPRDFVGTRLVRARALHLICAPSRAASIIAEVDEVPGWVPEIVYEPVEYACVPEELPALTEILPHVSILSPNAGEALRMLSIPHDASALTRPMIEDAAHRFLDLGVGSARAAPNTGCVLVRSAELGAYVVTRRPGDNQGYRGHWIDAYWTKDDEAKVVDVTGAGNSFLGGVAAALSLAGGDVFEAALYGSVSASFVIEQQGLPIMTTAAGDTELWNGEAPADRLRSLKARHQ